MKDPLVVGTLLSFPRENTKEHLWEFLRLFLNHLYLSWRLPPTSLWHQWSTLGILTNESTRCRRLLQTSHTTAPHQAQTDNTSTTTAHIELDPASAPCGAGRRGAGHPYASGHQVLCRAKGRQRRRRLCSVLRLRLCRTRAQGAAVRSRSSARGARGANGT